MILIPGVISIKVTCCAGTLLYYNYDTYIINRDLLKACNYNFICIIYLSECLLILYSFLSMLKPRSCAPKQRQKKRKILKTYFLAFLPNEIFTEYYLLVQLISRFKTWAYLKRTMLIHIIKNNIQHPFYITY